MSDKLSNSKTLSAGKKKYLDNIQFNFNDAVKSNCPSHCPYDQQRKNNFSTKKSERVFQKSNSKSFNCKSDVENRDLLFSLDHNSTKNEIISNSAEKQCHNETEGNQKNEQSSISETFKLYHCNVDKSSTLANQMENLPNKMLDELIIVRDENYISMNSEHHTDLDENYKIFKSEPTIKVTATSDMFNNQKLESGDGNAIKESKKIKNSSNLENLEIFQEKNKKDFQPVVEVFESRNYMPNTFSPASSTKCLHTGIHRKELFECLRKEISDPVSEMKKDITAFCNDAAKTADIKEGNSQFYLDVASDMSVKDTRQSLEYKSMKKNNNIEQYNNMIEANTCHKHKILQKNGNLRNHNCAGVRHEDDDDFVEDSSKTGFQKRSLISNNEVNITGKKIDLVSRKNKDTEQNNAENSEAIKMLSLENDAQLVTKKLGHDLSSQIIGTKRKRSKEEHDHENDITKKTIHDMINTARSRRKNIK